MLGKLFKYELRTTWKIPVLFVGVLLIISLVTGTSIAMMIWSIKSGQEWIGFPLSVFALALVYYAALIATNLGVTIYLAVHFYKSMYTDEGYLTHTLPVTSHQLLISKGLTICIWNLAAVAGVFLSMLLLGGSLMLFMAEEFADIKDAVTKVLRMGMEMHLGGFLGSAGAMMAVSVFYSASVIMGSITIGQMLRKHRILGAIGAYFGITSVVGAVSMVLSMVVMFASVTMINDPMDIFSVYTPMYLIMAIIEVAACVGLYFLSEYLIRKHLELE